MSKITLGKTHALLEKLTDYVISEMATKTELNGLKIEMDKRFNHVESALLDTRKDIRLIIDGMDSQVKESEIIKTEQLAIKSGLSRLENRVDQLEKKQA